VARVHDPSATRGKSAILQLERVVIYYERLPRDKRDRLGTYLLNRTAIFQPSMVVDYHRARCYGSPPKVIKQKAERISRWQF
jgi:hypothetical protein